MERLTSILVCVDPERTPVEVLDRAGDVARTYGARLKLLHVISEYPEDLSKWWNVRNPEKLHAQIVREREANLEKLAERLRSRGLKDVSFALRWGKHFSEITREVVENGHDLAILTPRYQHPSALTKLRHECPSVDLLRHCPCTFWIAKGNLLGPSRRIAAAIDWHRDTHECVPLSEKVLRNAAALAVAEKAELHVVHALVHAAHHGEEERGAGVDATFELESLRDEMASKCNGALAEFDLSLDKGQIHLLSGGGAADIIARFTHEQQIDVIVLGTVRRKGFAAVLSGGVAEKVFEQVDCDVIVVKPDDFESNLAHGVLADDTLQSRKRELERIEAELERKRAELNALQGKSDSSR